MTVELTFKTDPWKYISLLLHLGSPNISKTWVFSRGNENHSFLIWELGSWGTCSVHSHIIYQGDLKQETTKNFGGTSPDLPAWTTSNLTRGVGDQGHAQMGIRRPEFSLAGIQLLGDIGQWAASSTAGLDLGHYLPADRTPLTWVRPWHSHRAPGMKLAQPPTFHLDCSHSLRCSALPLIHSHEVVCHSFFLRSIAQKESFEYQFTFTLLSTNMPMDLSFFLWM